MHIQALILPVLVALHNFIWQYDSKDIQPYDGKLIDEESPPESTEELGTGLVTPVEML
jgi:hypothetical protein